MGSSQKYKGLSPGTLNASFITTCLPPVIQVAAAETDAALVAAIRTAETFITAVMRSTMRKMEGEEKAQGSTVEDLSRRLGCRGDSSRDDEAGPGQEARAARYLRHLGSGGRQAAAPAILERARRSPPHLMCAFTLWKSRAATNNQ